MNTENREIRELQEEMLVLLKKFHEICNNNNIMYTLHGGTLLGAVREKGFIPWDDDIDVAMMRDEYIKLKAIFDSEEKGDMVFDVESDKIKKIWMMREGRPKVWLDIFIYTGVSDKKIIQKIKIAGLTLLAPFAKSKEGMAQFEARKRIRGVKRTVYKCINAFGSIFPLKWRNRLFDKFCLNVFTGNGTLIHRANDQSIGIVVILDASCMKSYHLASFEDTELMITDGYDVVLSTLYGSDYMIPKREYDNNDAVHNTVRNSK